MTAFITPPTFVWSDLINRETLIEKLNQISQDVNFFDTAFGSMSLQNADAVAITGGTIDNVLITTGFINDVPIGQTTPDAGFFTTLSATGAINFDSGTIDGVVIGGTTPAAGEFTTLEGATITGTVAVRAVDGTSIMELKAVGGPTVNFYLNSEIRLQAYRDATGLSFDMYDTGLVYASTPLILHQTGKTEINGDLDHDGSNVGFYGTAPVVKYNTVGTATGFTQGAGTEVRHTSTFTGNTGATAYTIGDIVRALKLIGIITA